MKNLTTIPIKQLQTTESDEENLLQQKDQEILDSAPTTSIKILYLVYGMLTVLIILNIAKILGYWPFSINLEVITGNDLDVNFSNLPRSVKAKHIIVNEDELASFFSPKLVQPRLS